jgi:hypothetical protein
VNDLKSGANARNRDLAKSSSRVPGALPPGIDLIRPTSTVEELTKFNRDRFGGARNENRTRRSPIDADLPDGWPNGADAPET